MMENEEENGEVEEEEKEEEVKANLENIVNRANNYKANHENENLDNKIDDKKEKEEVEMKHLGSGEIINNVEERKFNEDAIRNNMEEEVKKEEMNNSPSKSKKKLSKDFNEKLLMEEPLAKRVIMLFFEGLLMFFLSLYPNWCDEFEQRNPIIERRRVQEVPNAEMTQKKNEDENDILIENVEVNRNNQPNSNIDKDRSERLIKSTNSDTKKVNPDDDQTKYHFVEENENKTENEFVFSENVNIDNLSYYNEPISDNKKKETEKQKLN